MTFVHRLFTIVAWMTPRRPKSCLAWNVFKASWRISNRHSPRFDEKNYEPASIVNWRQHASRCVRSPHTIRSSRIGICRADSRARPFHSGLDARAPSATRGYPFMSEKYRVCLYTEDQETRLGLCQLTTDDSGTTRCVATASTEVFATLDDLKRGIDRMRVACELPALTITDNRQLAEGFDESLLRRAGGAAGGRRDPAGHTCRGRTQDEGGRV
jgi:hypothetical protein